MAQNIYACLDGEVVATGALTGPFRACPACGHKRAKVVTTVTEPHYGQIVCLACDGHISWLGRDHMAALLAQKRGNVA